MEKKFAYSKKVSLPLLRREVEGLLEKVPGPFVDGDVYDLGVQGRELVVHLEEKDVVLKGGNINRHPSVTILPPESNCPYPYIPMELFFDKLQ